MNPKSAIPAKVMFEIYRDAPGAGAYRVVYYSELEEHERDDAIEKALNGQHVFDGFVPTGEEPKARIAALLERLNAGAVLERDGIRSELEGVLVN